MDVNIQELLLDGPALDPESATLLKDCLVKKRNLVSLQIRDLDFIHDSSGSGLHPVVHLANGIASNGGLKKLCLECCNIDSPGWIVMMEMVQDHKSLASIRIGRMMISMKQLLTILQNIRANPRIRELGFHSMKLPGKGMPDIAAFLAGNSSLENLQLVNVRLDSSSGCLIARALMSNTTLTALNLAANRLGRKFATACRQLLEYNNHLEILNLSENELTDRGAEALANGLRKNQKLAVLCLETNGIKERGGLAIASMLALNSSLTELPMENNPCGEKAGAAISVSLETNTTLACMSNDNCGFADRDREFIESITTRNARACASRKRDALLLSRHGPGSASWLPPEAGALVMHYLLMQSATSDQYESVATEMELAMNALAHLAKDKPS